jgi:hypothetical protein
VGEGVKILVQSAIPEIKRSGTAEFFLSSSFVIMLLGGNVICCHRSIF